MLQPQEMRRAVGTASNAERTVRMRSRIESCLGTLPLAYKLFFGTNVGMNPVIATPTAKPTASEAILVLVLQLHESTADCLPFPLEGPGVEPCRDCATAVHPQMGIVISVAIYATRLPVWNGPRTGMYSSDAEPQQPRCLPNAEDAQKGAVFAGPTM